MSAIRLCAAGRPPYGEPGSIRMRLRNGVARLRRDCHVVPTGKHMEGGTGAMRNGI